MIENKKIGFIGAGNMASAFIRGLLSSGSVNAENICVSDADVKKLQELSHFGITLMKTNIDLINNCDIVIIAVKPHIVPIVLNEYVDVSGGINKYKNKIFVSIAAGVTIKKLESILTENAKITRTMPNTPAAVNCAMSVISPNANVTADELETVKQIFCSIGNAEILDEKYINAATALQGSSPAYIYMLIDALADGGVKHGIPKDISLRLAAKAVEGSAKMVLQTGEHPEKLKDNVCSPGGTTIEAVASLEKNGFRAAILSAIDAVVQKADKMSES